MSEVYTKIVIVNEVYLKTTGLPLITYAPMGRGGGVNVLYICIAYYMQKGGEGGGPDSM